MGVPRFALNRRAVLAGLPLTFAASPAPANQMAPGIDRIYLWYFIDICLKCPGPLEIRRAASQNDPTIVNSWAVPVGKMQDDFTPCFIAAPDIFNRIFAPTYHAPLRPEAEVMNRPGFSPGNRNP